MRSVAHIDLGMLRYWIILPRIIFLHRLLKVIAQQTRLIRCLPSIKLTLLALKLFFTNFYLLLDALGYRVSPGRWTQVTYFQLLHFSVIY